MGWRKRAEIKFRPTALPPELLNELALGASTFAQRRFSVHFGKRPYFRCRPPLKTSRRREEAQSPSKPQEAPRGPQPAPAGPKRPRSNLRRKHEQKSCAIIARQSARGKNNAQSYARQNKLHPKYYANVTHNTGKFTQNYARDKQTVKSFARKDGQLRTAS